MITNMIKGINKEGNLECLVYNGFLFTINAKTKQEEALSINTIRTMLEDEILEEINIIETPANEVYETNQDLKKVMIETKEDVLEITIKTDSSSTKAKLPVINNNVDFEEFLPLVKAHLNVKTQKLKQRIRK